MVGENTKNLSFSKFGYSSTEVIGLVSIKMYFSPT